MLAPSALSFILSMSVCVLFFYFVLLFGYVIIYLVTVFKSSQRVQRIAENQRTTTMFHSSCRWDERRGWAADDGDGALEFSPYAQRFWIMIE